MPTLISQLNFLSMESHQQIRVDEQNNFVALAEQIQDDYEERRRALRS